MKKDKIVKITLSGLALFLVMMSLTLLPACKQWENTLKHASVDRQMRSLLEEVLDVKLVEAGSEDGYGSPDGSVREMGTDYDVEGRLLDPSQIINSLVNVVQSLGVQQYEAGVVGSTSVVVFQELSIVGGKWSGFIEVHRQIARWYIKR